MKISSVKKIRRLFFIAVLFFVGDVYAVVESKPRLVRWMDYTEALEKAKNGHKLVFIDLYADWCIPCRVMDKNVFSDPTIASLLNNRFYSARLNVDSQDTIVCDGQRKTPQRCYFDVWELSVLPAFVLMAPKGLTILTVSDSMSPEELKMLLFQFLEKEKEWIER